MRTDPANVADKLKGALYGLLAVSCVLFLSVTYCLHVHGVM